MFIPGIESRGQQTSEPRAAPSPLHGGEEHKSLLTEKNSRIKRPGAWLNQNSVKYFWFRVTVWAGS